MVLRFPIPVLLWITPATQTLLLLGYSFVEHSNMRHLWEIGDAESISILPGIACALFLERPKYVFILYIC